MNVTIKVVLIGDEKSEKTALREKYLARGFSAQYMMTIGADFALKPVKIHYGSKVQTINVQIWDLASQVHFRKARTLYYKGVKAFIAVIDVTRYESYINLIDYFNEIKKLVPKISEIPILLIGNKVDLRIENEPSHIPTELGQQMAEKISKFLGNGNMKVSYIELLPNQQDIIEKAFNDLIKTVVVANLNSDYEVSDLVRPAHIKLPIIIQQKSDLEIIQESLVKCPNCFEKILIWEQYCPRCGFEMPRCQICKRILKEIEFTCPNCHHPFHKKHWFEYYEIKGNCPICKK